MEFNISFKTGKKNKAIDKSDVVGRVSNTSGIEMIGNSIFYPINLFDSYNTNVLIDMYEQIPEIQTPINYVIDKMANIPFYLVEKTRSGEEKIIEDSPELEVLNNPNQYMNKSDYIKSFFLNSLVLGVGYINRIEAIGLGYRQLYILPSASTKPKINKVSTKDYRLNEITGYTVNWGNGEIGLDKDEVIVQYEANLSKKPTEIRSRLMSAILTSESLRYNYEARVKIYRDRGALGVLSPKEAMTALTKEQADFMRDQYKKETGITGGKSPVLVSQRGVEYTQIGLNVADLKLNENKLQDFQTVCNVLQVDPALFDNTRSTYNNKVLAKKNFWEDVGIPKFNSFLELQGKVFNFPPNKYFKADYSDIPALQEDFKDKVEANSKAYNDGAITQEEYRSAIGYEGGEKTFKGASGQSNKGQSE